jgi:hypothetical protein
MQLELGRPSALGVTGIRFLVAVEDDYTPNGRSWPTAGARGRNAAVRHDCAPHQAVADLKVPVQEKLTGKSPHAVKLVTADTTS